MPSADGACDLLVPSLLASVFMMRPSVSRLSPPRAARSPGHLSSHMTLKERVIAAEHFIKDEASYLAHPPHHHHQPHPSWCQHPAHTVHSSHHPRSRRARYARHRFCLRRQPAAAAVASLESEQYKKKSSQKKTSENTYCICWPVKNLVRQIAPRGHFLGARLVNSQ